VAALLQMLLTVGPQTYMAMSSLVREAGPKDEGRSLSDQEIKAFITEEIGSIA